MDKGELMKDSTRFIKENKKWQDYDPTDKEWGKLDPDIEPGDRIEILWSDELDNMVDDGYVFELPWCYSDSGDFFVHIPEPNNPDGKDIPGPEWKHVRELMNNKFVVSISKA